MFKRAIFIVQIILLLQPLGLQGHFYSETDRIQLTPSITANVVELGNVELNRQLAKKSAHTVDLEAMRRAQYRDLNPDETFKTVSTPIRTIQDPIVARQSGQECGIRSVLNSVQLHSLLSESISPVEFEASMRSQDPTNLTRFVEEECGDACPIDEVSMVRLAQKELPFLRKNQITTIPNIYTFKPFKSVYAYRSRESGDFEYTFQREESLLNAIDKIRDPRVQNYIHIFYLNNKEDIDQPGGAGHWTTVVLHKKDGEVTLYGANSANDTYPSSNIVDIENLMQKSTVDIHKITDYLAPLLQVDPNVLEYGLNITQDLSILDNYKENIVPGTVSNYSHIEPLKEQIKRDINAGNEEAQELLALFDPNTIESLSIPEEIYPKEEDIVDHHSSEKEDSDVLIIDIGIDSDTDFESDQDDFITDFELCQDESTTSSYFISDDCDQKTTNTPDIQQVIDHIAYADIDLLEEEILHAIKNHIIKIRNFHGDSALYEDLSERVDTAILQGQIGVAGEAQFIIDHCL